MTYASGHLLTGVAAYSSAKGEHILSGRLQRKDRARGLSHRAVGLPDARYDLRLVGHRRNRRGLPERADGAQWPVWHRVTYPDDYSDGLLTEKQQPGGRSDPISVRRQHGSDAAHQPTGSTQTMTYDTFGDELSTSTNLDISGDKRVRDLHLRLAPPADVDHAAGHAVSDRHDDVSYNAKGELASTTSSGWHDHVHLQQGALPASETDGDGNVTTYTYDAYGNLTGESVRSPSGATPEGFGPLLRLRRIGPAGAVRAGYRQQGSRPLRRVRRDPHDVRRATDRRRASQRGGWRHRNDKLRRRRRSSSRPPIRRVNTTTTGGRRPPAGRLRDGRRTTKSRRDDHRRLRSQRRRAIQHAAPAVEHQVGEAGRGRDQCLQRRRRGHRTPMDRASRPPTRGTRSAT